MTKPWMLDELAHAGPEHLDPGFAAGFDRKRGYPSPTEDLAVVAGHGVGPASTVVDLGAGTGQFALAADHLAARPIWANLAISSGMVARRENLGWCRSRRAGRCRVRAGVGVAVRVGGQ
jgi:hypothetical protein